MRVFFCFCFFAAIKIFRMFTRQKLQREGFYSLINFVSPRPSFAISWWKKTHSLSSSSIWRGCFSLYILYLQFSWYLVNITFAGITDTVFHVSLVRVFPRETLASILNREDGELVVQSCFCTFHKSVASLFVVRLKQHRVFLFHQRNCSVPCVVPATETFEFWMKMKWVPKQSWSSKGNFF